MLRGLRCVRCGERTGLRYDTSGCSGCRAAGVPSALVADHDLSGVDGAALWAEWSRRRPGLWSHHELLPVDAAKAVTLAEGATPLLELDGGVLLKDERRNPTGSFKDRFFTTAVSWAREAGASTVAVASSGNAGVAAAAYAAAAGLESVVVTTGEISGTASGLVRRFGGRLLFGDTPEQRWAILREHADEWTVLTNTSEVPVSSLWVGVEGYKTIAYEIVRDLGDVPEVVLAPVSRGDGFAGMWLGFQELQALGVVSRTPRMVAVERYPSLSRALREGAEPPPANDVTGPVEATSISNPQATVMSLRVIRESGGTAVACTDADLHEAAERLGRAGVGAELSSAAGLVGIDALRRDSLLEPGDRAVALVTSHAANQPGTLR
ncbi:pyridoxal-phosphate dependent enzyme [Saccharopolyspora erythraea]|uniref:threonine synthase n=1 Tax=Saccharopolyspora erythraea TaxID=1836 RepID=UPI001BAD4917|nr:pyridoxal-phosphate dependent enzyme [Saccharopolyspora erythraea]QUH00263.1 pyridoxal-phosphate dependent enzyme [Saccharopolyspora erythraea]